MDTGKDDVMWEWEELEEVDSTNRFAMERVLARWRRGERAEGLVVVARRQTAGRGQHGRRWESPAGGLYMSAVLEDVPVELRGPLALVVGAAVVAGLEELGAKDLKIRWPNDVVVAGSRGPRRKLAGILCEALAQGGRWAVVVGIGVNVAQVELPVELAAVSLEAIGVSAPLRRVAEAILPHIAAIPAARLADAVAQVGRRDVLRGARVRLHDGTQEWEGMGAGIDDAGRLLLQLQGGQVEAFERGSLLA